MPERQNENERFWLYKGGKRGQKKNGKQPLHPNTLLSNRLNEEAM